MVWLTPKTDWTSNDYYNFQDLNRVENNIKVLVDLINTYSSMYELTVNTGRGVTTIEYFDSLNRIENNILALKNATSEPIGWITPKTDWVSVLNTFDYVAANRLESNLQALYDLVNNAKNYLQYCGTFTCGQNNTYL